MAIALNMEAVSSSLFQLLVKLMDTDELKDFYLVGGTALALYLAHRRSNDIDLFTTKKFDSQLISAKLERMFRLKNVIQEANTVRGFVDDIKVELFTHDYHMIEEIPVIEGIRIAGLSDLVAMKLNAIAGRGSKKDFWDIAYLLDHFSFKEMVSYFEKKYPNANKWHLIKSMTYFQDADNELTEIIDLKKITWDEVKYKILNSLKDYTKDSYD